MPIPLIAVALLIGIGLMILLLKKNMIKMVMGLGIVEGAVNLFLVALGYRENGVAPIFVNAPADSFVGGANAELQLGVAVINLIFDPAIPLQELRNGGFVPR